MLIHQARTRRLVLFALIPAMLTSAAFAGIIYYDAKRYERAYEQIRIGMPLSEAQAIMESLPGGYGDRRNDVYVQKREGQLFIPASMRRAVIGDGRVDFLNAGNGEVWGRQRYWTDDSRMVWVSAKNDQVVVKGYGATRPLYMLWLIRCRVWLGI